MKQYIDKSALVAEIERITDEQQEICKADVALGKAPDSKNIEVIYQFQQFTKFLDTIEVKEIDLDFMLHEYWNLSSKITIDCLESATMTKDEMINFAKHFFELGLKAKME